MLAAASRRCSAVSLVAMRKAPRMDSEIVVRAAPCGATSRKRARMGGAWFMTDTDV